MADSRDGTESDARPTRRVRRRWMLPVAAATLVATVGVACAPWLLSNPAGMSRCVAGLLPELAGDVTFDRVRVGWLGPMVLEGVRVVPHDGSPPPLSVARIEVANGLAAILASFGDVGRVRVAGLVADVAFDERRRSNIAGLFRPAAGDAPPSSAGRGRRSAVRMRLDVEAAVVQIAGPWGREPWRSEPLDLRAALAPAADGPWSEWTVDPVDLLADARLEPGVAQGVLAYVAPILAGAARTSGRFSLRLDGVRVPVGRPGDGTVSGTLVMHEVVVGPGPMVENLVGSLPVRLAVPPDIRIADESRVTFRLADRRVTHEGLEFGFPLPRSGQRLDVQSSGSVAIDDGGLDLRLRLPIPADLPQDRPVLAALAGKAVSLGVRGTLASPRVDFDGSFRETAGEFVGDLVDRLRTGPRDGDAPADGGPTAAGDAAEAAIDVIGGLIEEIAKRRAERRAAEQEEGPQTQPPRRIRDRLRGGRGREPAEGP
ncbi:MAG: hypothetical protein ACKOZU_06985 [Planctomycetaceae bacterium]